MSGAISFCAEKEKPIRLRRTESAEGRTEIAATSRPRTIKTGNPLRRTARPTKIGCDDRPSAATGCPEPTGVRRGKPRRLRRHRSRRPYRRAHLQGHHVAFRHALDVDAHLRPG